MGEACVRTFAAGGGKCVILDLDQGRGEELIGQLPSGLAIFIRTDVSAEEQVAAAVDRAIGEFGRAGILVNVAGISSVFGPALIENIDIALWTKMMSVNLTGTFLMTKYTIPLMKRQRYGRIVNIASTAVLGAGYRGQAPYCASKASVVGLMLAVTREGGPFGIRCNAVGPGPTKTPSRTLLVQKEREIERTVPVGFIADAVDVANPVAFLSSKLARFITGQLLFVDGGVSIPWNIDHIVPVAEQA
nr:SDR family NAD(P)-dependent oxidoreductase [Mesorhizobium sp. M7A.F.Ca.US.006.01.1.1]